jgi:hypothetical protein
MATVEAGLEATAAEGALPRRILGRFFGLVDGDDPARRARRLHAFEAIFALVVGTEYWLRALPKWGRLASHYDALLAIATAACAAILFTRWRRPAFAALAASHAVLVWSEFPSAGNHAYLELAYCALAAFLAIDDEAEGALYLRAVRWLVVVVLFYSGLQKLVHGYYFGGEFLAFSAPSAAFRPLFALLLGDAEMARLAALDGSVGDGPYRVASWPLVAASNATWLGEILLAPVLCWRRTRAVGVAAAVVLVLAIEIAAREVFFGLVFLDAILLFARRDLHSRLVPAVAVLLAAMALSRLGVLPEVVFH